MLFARLFLPTGRSPRDPRRPAGRRSRRVGTRAGIVLLIALFVIPAVTAGSLGWSGHHPADPVSNAPGPALATAGALPLRLDDRGVLNLTVLGVVVGQLTDAILPGPSTPDHRNYTINVQSLQIEPLVTVRLITDPVTQWGVPTQFPGGSDALPPLSAWNWTIYSQGVDDSGNWSPNFEPGTLGRDLPWGNYSFRVSGSLQPAVSIVVNASSVTGQLATSVAFSLNGALAPGTNSSNDSDYASLGQALHPSMVRLSLVSSGSHIAWNLSTHGPRIGWRGFDALANFSTSVGAPVYLSLPVGTWGDGNFLPAGMPLLTSILVQGHGLSGHFPTALAYRTFVHSIAAHVASTNESVLYWNIGNEVPLDNATEVGAFAHLLTVAAAAVHAVLPTALVGSDVLLDRTYLSQFAHTTTGVGFLAFHYYPALSMCSNGGHYCPPSGGGHGTPDGLLMTPSFSISQSSRFLAPHLGQELWHNITGSWLPVLDAESNLNSVGGLQNPGLGSDPRQQTLFGGAWVASTLIDGARENLSTFTYFVLTGPPTVPATVTGPFGGWGFGMTSEGTQDNDTRFAPYWALQMYATGVPAGAPVLSTSGSDASTVEAMAFQNCTGVSVLLVNRANLSVPVTIAFQGSGTFAPTSVRTLDSASYQDLYSPTAGTMNLTRSSVNSTFPAANPVALLMTGYSVALLSEHVVVTHHATFVGNGTPDRPPHIDPTDRSVGPPSDPMIGSLAFVTYVAREV